MVTASKRWSNCPIVARSLVHHTNTDTMLAASLSLMCQILVKATKTPLYLISPVIPAPAVNSHSFLRQRLSPNLFNFFLSLNVNVTNFFARCLSLHFHCWLLFVWKNWYMSLGFFPGFKSGFVDFLDSPCFKDVCMVFWFFFGLVTYFNGLFSVSYVYRCRLNWLFFLLWLSCGVRVLLY